MFNNVGTYLYNNGLRGSIGGKCLNMSINDTNELIYETEIDPQTENLWLPKGKVEGADKLGVWD